jgi:hypothetical protein
MTSFTGTQGAHGFGRTPQGCGLFNPLSVDCLLQSVYDRGNPAYSRRLLS